MTTQFPLEIKKTGRGRPPEDGERYPGGKLKAKGAKPELLAHRQSIAADPTMGENPLDAAFANGWLDRADYRAGVTYVMLHRQAKIGAPRASAVSYGESEPIDREGVDGNSIVDMTDAEIGAIWAEVFSQTAEETVDARDAREAAAMAKLRAIHADMTLPQRGEVHLVCVQESWPPWFMHRRAGVLFRAKAEAEAKAERRALTDEEQAYIFKKFNTNWERKRDVLIAGLRSIAKTMSGGRPPRERAPRIEHAAARPSDNRGFKRTVVTVEE